MSKMALERISILFGLKFDTAPPPTVPHWAFERARRMKSRLYSEDEIRQGLIQQGLSWEKSFAVLDELERQHIASESFFTRLERAAVMRRKLFNRLMY